MAIMSMATITLAGTGGSQPYTAFPPDFGAWLASRSEFNVVATKSETFGGRAGSQIDADFVWVAGSRKYEFLHYADNQGWLYDDGTQGNRARFVILPGSGWTGVVILMESPITAFDAASAALDQLLAGLSFR
jgi:hypothetical protein